MKVLKLVIYQKIQNTFLIIFVILYCALKNLCYGIDYDTTDGSCIRDFIDVQDLSKIIYFFINKNSVKKIIFNVGINKGFSVLDIINKFQTILKIKINYKIAKRRKGDAPRLVCNNSNLKRFYKRKFNNIQTSIINHYKFYKKINNKDL